MKTSEQLLNEEAENKLQEIYIEHQQSGGGWVAKVMRLSYEAGQNSPEVEKAKIEFAIEQLKSLEYSNQFETDERISKLSEKLNQLNQTKEV